MAITRLITLSAALAVGAWTWSAAAADKAEVDHAYAVKVENAAAKVGEETTIQARIAVQDGYHFSKAYRNRLIKLSTEDDSVAFDDEVVIGTQEGDELVFKVPVKPTKPGEHPVNGVFRIGFHKDGQVNMVSAPLMAKVTGTN